MADGLTSARKARSVLTAEMLDKGLGAGDLSDDGEEVFVGKGLSQYPYRALRAFGERFGGRVFFGRGEDYGDLLGLGHRLEAVTRLYAAQLGDRNVHDYEVYPAGERSWRAVRPSVAETTRKARVLQGSGGASQGFYVVVCDHDGCSAVHGARFYTHFTFAASVMCATLLSDAAG